MYISMPFFLYYEVHVVSVSLDYLFVCYVHKISLADPVCLRVINPVGYFSGHLVWECFVSVNLIGAPAGLCRATAF